MTAPNREPGAEPRRDTPDDEPLRHVTVDHDRSRRCGFPEVVYCQGKTPEQARDIATEILSRAPRVLLTRADPSCANTVCERYPEASYDPLARCITIDPTPLPKAGRVAIVAAGTADAPVAEEARITLGIMGRRVDTHFDIGVAGIHRLLERIPAIRRASVIIAVAGMEGALPSVLAGLVDRPIIGLPTSTGYGTGVEGLAALATMLNTCAAGIAVVNIDNGFGAAYLACQIDQATSAEPPAQPPAEEPREPH